MSDKIVLKIGEYQIVEEKIVGGVLTLVIIDLKNDVRRKLIKIE